MAGVNPNQWSRETFDAVISILRRTRLVDYSAALAEISRLTNLAVTESVLRGRFKRAGLGAPSVYCSAALAGPTHEPIYNYSSVALDADDDGPVTERAPKVDGFDRFWVDRTPEIAPAAAKTARRILIVPDIHAPVHNARAIGLMLKAMADWRPDVIVCLGDLIDCSSVSSYSKKPSALTLLDEVKAANDILDSLDALGASEKCFTVANHEQRIERTIIDKAPGLLGLADVPDLLRFRDRGWKWCDYKDYIQVGKIAYTHDMGNGGAQAHTKAKDAVGRSTVIGHTHRMSWAADGTIHDGTRVAAMFGHLLDTDQVHYMYKAQLRHWQLGFGTGIMLEDGVTFLRPHPIVNYTCEVDSKVYAA